MKSAKKNKDTETDQNWAQSKIKFLFALNTNLT